MRIIVKEINSYHFYKVILKLILPSNSGHEALVSTILAGGYLYYHFSQSKRPPPEEVV